MRINISCGWLGGGWTEHKTYHLISQNLPTLILLQPTLSVMTMMIMCCLSTKKFLDAQWNGKVLPLEINFAQQMINHLLNGRVQCRMMMFSCVCEPPRPQGWWKISQQICSVASSRLLVIQICRSEPFFGGSRKRRLGGRWWGSGRGGW